MVPKFKSIDHGSTVIVATNRPELLYVLAWCEDKNKKTSEYMYKINKFPYYLSVNGSIVGWVQEMDRALYYKPFNEFVKDIEDRTSCAPDSPAQNTMERAAHLTTGVIEP